MTTDRDFDAPPQKKSTALWWVLGCGGLLAVGLVCGVPLFLCAGAMGLGYNEVSKQEKRVIDEPGVEVTAVELSKSPSMYQDKVVRLIGTVKSKDSNELVLAGIPGGNDITCTAGMKLFSLYDNVSPGDTVTVKGLCEDGELTGCQSVTKK